MIVSQWADYPEGIPVGEVFGFDGSKFTRLKAEAFIILNDKTIESRWNVIDQDTFDGILDELVCELPECFFQDLNLGVVVKAPAPNNWE